VVVSERSIAVSATKVRYLEAGPKSGHVVLFLHGGRFEANTWKDLGTLETVAKRGYRVIAVDLPGHGGSGESSAEPMDFMDALLQQLEVEPPVLVLPSASGRYGLGFAALHSDRLAGLVPIAPVGVQRFAEILPNARIPALVLWGSDDQVFPVEGAVELAGLLPDATVHVFEGARHPAYLDKPDEFHEVLLDFLDRVFAD